MAQFNPGEMVDFFRNPIIQQDNTPVSVVFQMPSGPFGSIGIEQPYIIEFTDGWLPNAQQVQKYNLDPETRYIFAFESELQAAP